MRFYGCGEILLFAVDVLHALKTFILRKAFVCPNLNCWVIIIATAILLR